MLRSDSVMTLKLQPLEFSSPEVRKTRLPNFY